MIKEVPKKYLKEENLENYYFEIDMRSGELKEISLVKKHKEKEND